MYYLPHRETNTTKRLPQAASAAEPIRNIPVNEPPKVPAVATKLPDVIVAPGETPVATFHAEGAQVYECKASADGKLAWQFREPIATLFLDGKTVGRHYAGPNWEHIDGSAVVAKVTGSAPSTSAKDLDLVKLVVSANRGSGVLTGVTTVQRINTRGGKLAGACKQAGAFQSVPYAADYVFLKKS
jgi:hypothetical protein